MKRKSKILEAVHESARELHKIGLIDKRKMNKYNLLCGVEVPDYNPKQIKSLRERYHLSQSVLAALINASPSTVQKWEMGEKHPSGPSLKLLSILDAQGVEVLMGT